MGNQHIISTNINYRSIFNYLKNYGNTPYSSDVKKKKLTAVAALKKLAALCQQKFGLDKCFIPIEQLKRLSTRTKNYLLAQMKYSDREYDSISISIFIEIVNTKKARYKVSLEINDDADNAAIERYHRHLDFPLNQDAGLIYSADIYSAYNFEKTEEISMYSHGQIRDDLNAGKFKRIQIVKYIDQQPGQTNEYFEQTILASVEAILPYYNHVVGKEAYGQIIN